MFHSMGNRFQQGRDHSHSRPLHVRHHDMYLRGRLQGQKTREDNTDLQGKGFPCPMYRNLLASKGLLIRDLGHTFSEPCLVECRVVLLCLGGSICQCHKHYR
jgi:hypothetical protein